jgi:hypothetical protein
LSLAEDILNYSLGYIFAGLLILLLILIMGFIFLPQDSVKRIMEINTKHPKHPVHVAKYIEQSMEFGKCCHTS